MYEFYPENTIINCSQSNPDLMCCERCLLDSCSLQCSSLQSPYCYCSKCDACRTNTWSYMSAGQVIGFLLFTFGFLLVIIIYFKICNRNAQAGCLGHTVLDDERNDEFTEVREHGYCTTPSSRVGPPSYIEACSAPPLYGSPYNTTSMLEAPPTYPDTPKLAEKMLHPVCTVTPITHHI